MTNLFDPAAIDATLVPRAATFENPTGAKGAGGTAHGGRKGAPSKRIAAGEEVVLADIEGPGTVRHIWMTYMPAPPEAMRAVYLEVFYDGAEEPSVSVPALDFFGVPHGRPVAYQSAMTSMQEGRGFNAYLPMPFRERCRIVLTNGGAKTITLYYQVDYTLSPVADDQGYLHVTFRRQNPTVQRDDFVITEGLRGPGRFFGCNVGVRVIDPCNWYGEGEVKMYLDGDCDPASANLPTICGTGLEDYIGTAWGLGPHAAHYAGAPLIVGSSVATAAPDSSIDDAELVGFYRWHVADPIMFASDLKVTIQQIGAQFFLQGQEEAMAAYEVDNPPAGAGWLTDLRPPMLAWGLAERVDDFCATAYVYCTSVQAVPRVDVALAVADIGRRSYESARPMEMLADAVAPPTQA